MSTVCWTVVSLAAKWISDLSGNKVNYFCIIVGFDIRMYGVLVVCGGGALGIFLALCGYTLIWIYPHIVDHGFSLRWGYNTACRSHRLLRCIFVVNIWSYDKSQLVWYNWCQSFRQQGWRWCLLLNIWRARVSVVPMYSREIRGGFLTVCLSKY